MEITFQFKINFIIFYFYTDENNMVERETLEIQEGKKDR